MNIVCRRETFVKHEQQHTTKRQKTKSKIKEMAINSVRQNSTCQKVLRNSDFRFIKNWKIMNQNEFI